MGISLVVNLGLLGFFKYFGFFTESLFALLNSLGWEGDPWTLKVLLPVGISFYTFQTLAYVIDVYRGQIKAARDPFSFFAFVAFFPQLVAGPIERASRLLPQFHEDKKFSYPQAVEGLRWLLWGMFKKLVIADRLAIYVQEVYSAPENFSGPMVVVAIVFFGFQVYCDFSGYSAMAIGTAKLFGFDLMVNFRTPFFSGSIKEFWTRWHISLSTWFRDYIYFPIGGSRKGWLFWGLGILTTFLVSGVWHGAAFTFICFGLFHGSYYLIEQSLVRTMGKSIQFPRWLAVIITLFGVNIGWSFFRAETISDSFLMIGKSFQGWGFLLEGGKLIRETLLSLPGFSGDDWFVWPSIIILFTIEGFIKKGTVVEFFDRIPRPARWGLAYFLIVWMLLFGAYQLKQSFVYFQF